MLPLDVAGWHLERATVTSDQWQHGSIRSVQDVTRYRYFSNLQ